eukprot:11209153-Ditylum_brightwellii.AAC.1
MDVEASTIQIRDSLRKSVRNSARSLVFRPPSNKGRKSQLSSVRDSFKGLNKLGSLRDSACSLVFRPLSNEGRKS